MIETWNVIALAAVAVVLSCGVILICIWMIRAVSRITRRGRNRLVHHEKIKRVDWIVLFLIGTALLSFLLLTTYRIIILFISPEDVEIYTIPESLTYKEILSNIFNGRRNELMWNHYLGGLFYSLGFISLVTGVMILLVVMLRRWKVERTFNNGKGMTLLGKNNNKFKDMRFTGYFLAIFLSKLFHILWELFRDWYL
ncbi:hypothetical protein [Paenibacillus sp. Marseille-Q7038]